MWEDDYQHGEGVETWKDGSSYVGCYEFGKKHGKGHYKWADGAEFDGNWSDN